jgi:hypothetical protein
MGKIPRSWSVSWTIRFEPGDPHGIMLWEVALRTGVFGQPPATFAVLRPSLRAEVPRPPAVAHHTEKPESAQRGPLEMSHLELPRLCFRGAFKANAPTNDNLLSAIDTVGKTGSTPPAWSYNPNGSGLFNLASVALVATTPALTPEDVCRVVGAWGADGRFVASPSDDPVIQAPVLDVAALDMLQSRSWGIAKVVDLDPEQRRVTELIGLDLSVMLHQSTTNSPLIGVVGRVRATQMRDFWMRGIAPEDFPTDPTTKCPVFQASAVWQSVLDVQSWEGNISTSPILQQLKAQSPGQLSLRLAVTGYRPTAADPRFNYGRVFGVIGPWAAGEPTQLVAGRRLCPVAKPIAPFQVCPARIDATGQSLVIDLGNAIPGLVDSWTAPLVDTVQPVMLTPDNATVEPLGTPLAVSASWWFATAGMAQWSLTPAQVSALGTHRLGLVAASGTIEGLVLAEHPTGNYADVDARLLRLDPGDSATLNVYAWHLGQPLVGQSLSFALHQQLRGDTIGTLGLPVPSPDPLINSDPPDIFKPQGPPFTVTTGATGSSQLSLTVRGGPIALPQARQAIDSQVYFLGDPDGWQTWGAPGPPMGSGCALSVLVFNQRAVPASPTWADVAPILERYARLFPYMASLFDIGSQATITQYAPTILHWLTKLPDDPGYMPVTRDLSRSNRQLLIAYLQSIATHKSTPPST